MSLVEMVVALFVLTGALVSLLGGLITGLRASRTSETRTQVNALAVAWTENLQSLPWASVGYRPNDPSFGSATCPGTPCAGEPVVLASSTDTVAPAAGDQVVTTPNGVSVTRRTYLTWRADSGIGVASPAPDGSSYTLKHLTVQMTWTEASRTRVLTYEGLRTPTPTEVKPRNVTVTAAPTTAAPGGLTLSAAASPAQTLTAAYQLSTPVRLTVTTSAAVGSVSASWSDRNGNRGGVLTGDAAQTAWTMTLPATSDRYASGNLTFAVTATTSTGAVVAGSASVALTAPAAITLVTPAVAPTFCSSSTSPSQTWRDSTVQLEVLNVAATDLPTMTLSSTTVSGTMVYSGSVGSNGGPIFSYQVPAGTVVPTGSGVTSTVNATFAVRRAGDGSTGTASYPLTVTVAPNSGSCPS